MSEEDVPNGKAGARSSERPPRVSSKRDESGETPKDASRTHGTGSDHGSKVEATFSSETSSTPRVAIRPPEGESTPTKLPRASAPPRTSKPPRQSTPPRRDPTPSAPFGTASSTESLLPEPPPDPPSALSLAACFASVGAIICGLEALVAGVSTSELWLATSLGLFTGTVLGLTAAAATVPPLRYLPRIGPMVAMLAGALAGVPFMASPGLFEPLVGPNSRLVWVALVVGPLSGAVVGFVLGRAVQLRSMFFALVLSGGALVMLFLEPRLIALPGYPAAAWGIRVVPWGAAALALHQCRRRNAPPLARKPKIALVVIWALLAASPWLYAGRTRGQLDEVLALRHAQLGVLLARSLTDFDGDGASRYFGGGDCDDANPHVGPRAPEIAGNGVDDNCRGGDLPAPPARARVGAPPTTTAAPAPDAVSVVLVTLDAVRVDRVGCYGYTRDTTPSLDELAHRGRRFEHAYSGGGWTSISLPALLHGRAARSLRWERLFLVEGQDELGHRQQMLEPLAIPSLGPQLRVKSAVLVVRDERPTLAAQLAARGYRTAAVVDSGGNAFLLPGYGLDDGFERFDAEPIDDDTAVADRSLAALREIGDAPFFLWAHFYGPHAPDRRHADAPDFGGGSSERYDHEIAHADVQVGRILAAVAERDDVVVIVTADHGEILGPLTRAHGNDLNPYTVRVPLIVAGAGVEGGVETEAAGFVDVAQTVLAVAGARETVGDLRRPLEAGRHVIMDTWRFDARGRATLDLSAMGTSHELVIRDRLLATDYAVDPDDLERVPERREPSVELVDALDTYLENARPFPRTRP